MRRNQTKQNRANQNKAVNIKHLVLLSKQNNKKTMKAL